MRAPDADRRTIPRLSAGYAAGRLGSNTSAHRVDLAYRAGSRADLCSLTIDLSGRARIALPAMLDGAAARLAPRLADWPSVWLAPSGHGPWSIDRAVDSDLVIDDPTVSRRHAECAGLLRATP